MRPKNGLLALSYRWGAGRRADKVAWAAGFGSHPQLGCSAEEWFWPNWGTLSSSHVWMWELDYKDSWALKNWCFWTVVLEKTLESPLDCKEIQPIHPKGKEYWIFIGEPDAEAETPILWPPDVKSWLIWKDPDARKDWGWEEKGSTEDEMVGLYHWLNGHEFE